MYPHRRSRPPNGFKTYVDFVEFQERPVDVPEDDYSRKVEPNLLPGEIVIAEANNVLKFAPLKQYKTGISGTVFVTNFKVSFVTSLPVESKEAELHERSLQSQFLGVHDVCLSEIDLVQQIFEGSMKKKRLLQHVPLPSRLSGLQLVLKNLRVINLSFKFTPVGEDLRVAQALLHHAFPPTIDHLFLSCGHSPSPPGIPEFCLAQDWEKELQRTRCPNWRVSKHNEYFHLCPSLPMVFVVPRDLLDAELEQAAQHFQGTRPPVWCWGSFVGAALVRMAQISPNISDKISVTKSMGTLKRRKLEEESLQQENRMMGFVHRCHPNKLLPTIMDLDQMLPSLKDIQMSYVKLRELHTPDDSSQFWEQDRHYYSRWESSRWLSHVSKCLEKAQKAAVAILHQKSSVILQDSEGRDLSAVISSLVQLLLDPTVRTIRGFHTLIQKEWVALGHPFCTRLGHTRNQPEEQSPVWLLFLDCVHQVSLQHQAALEFTPEYLSALWHGSHCSLHSSFMFNTINSKYCTQSLLQRENPHHQVILRPVWSWWAENPSTQCNEQNGSLEEGIDRMSKARESFLNVHYIQNLLSSLSVSGALSRVRDTMSSAHDTWQRIKYLMGDCGPLPYDPNSPVVPLQLDASMRLDIHTHISNLKPWHDCFSGWLSEPSSLMLADSESLIRPSTTLPQHWDHIYFIYSHLKTHLTDAVANGMVK